MIGYLLPKQMRYQAALLPEPWKPLGFAREGRKRQGRFVATCGGTRQEQAHNVPK
jgi:hypothetical protein